MAKPKDILNTYDYCHYSHIRAMARRFILLGGLLLVSGIVCMFLNDRHPRQQVHPAFPLGLTFVGLVGVIGGMVVLRGNRRWVSAMKAMAYCYIIVFPPGPVLSYFLLTGLPRYLHSMDEIRSREDL